MRGNCVGDSLYNFYNFDTLLYTLEWESIYFYIILSFYKSLNNRIYLSTLPFESVLHLFVFRSTKTQFYKLIRNKNENVISEEHFGFNLEVTLPMEKPCKNWSSRQMCSCLPCCGVCFNFIVCKQQKSTTTDI